jgi:hypothetical protein
MRLLRRRAIWLLLLAIVAGLVLWRHGTRRRIAVPPEGVRVPVLPPLANKLVQVHYHQVPLSQVFADLSRQAGVRFNVDWKALRAGGLEASTVIDCDSESDQPMPLVAAIDWLTKRDGNLNADFTSDPVVITTSNEAAKNVLTVMYRIDDLIQLRDISSPALTRQERVDDLCKLIEDIVQRDSWKDMGGTVGSMNQAGDLLVVTATPMMHYQIKELLDVLRRQE